MSTSSLQSLRVLVSGAGVAGPALALRLAEHGARVTVVELAARLRTSGFAVDFRGPTHLAVLQRLGVLDELRALQTHGGAMICVDERDREIFALPAGFAGGDLEVRRSDLSRVLFDRGAGRVEHLFGDTVTALRDTGSAVEVRFGGAGTRTFDLVVGADGMHSAVRRLAFGPEPDFVRPLGYCIAGWDLPNSFGIERDSRQYNVPGRMASIGVDPRDPGRATALMVFRHDGDVDWRDQDAQRRLIAGAFAGLPWHVPAILDSLPGTAELYFDAIARVTVPQWTRGRMALLGDAAWGVTLGGMGVGTGIVGAHVLAGELAAARGDHAAALAAYEARMRTYAGRWQKGANPGRFLAPASRWGLGLRNRMFASRLVQRSMVSGTNRLATEAALPAYS